MTKEHFWPKWMIKHTNMEKTKIGWWNGTDVYPLAATIPLCGPCNHSLGSKLEAPMQQIFLDLEDGKGISDNEAEIFIRWCWKMEGFSWRLFAPEGEYSEVYTVTERALQNIDNIRPGLVLAIAFVKDYCEGREYKPMGLCNVNEVNAIVVSGVISSVAFMVLTDDQVGNLPINFSYLQTTTLIRKGWHLIKAITRNRVILIDMVLVGTNLGKRGGNRDSMNLSMRISGRDGVTPTIGFASYRHD